VKETTMSQPGFVGEGAMYGYDEDYWNQLPDEAQDEIRDAARAQAEFEEREAEQARADGVDLDPSH
jgi:TRAP-type C4-dicarboxylate transport system substrate-binding protein